MKGILLVNLGTPDSPQTPDVRKYLREFLMDRRVIDVPYWKRFVLVQGIIAPTRAPKSAVCYKEIWLDEGSPLMVHGKSVTKKIQEKLGADYKVVLAMRYQSPSIENGLKELIDAGVDSIKVVSMFPHYASASLGSVQEKVMEILSKYEVIPALEITSSFHDMPEMIQAFAERGRQYPIDDYDHVLFSFHGLPERHIKKACNSTTCLQGDCCGAMDDKNTMCYRAQCFDTARLIAKELNLSEDRYTICFQSRLGRDPWIKPYTVEEVERLGKEGKKKVLVFCPAFVCDCLETTFEISTEYQEDFEKFGGEKLQLVEGLNDMPQWIDALEKLAK
ncbi:MAG: ferrochelatase [Sphingobacteriales bacterium]|jgi:ferrochelatase